jgi:RNA polymerase sigma-70 factor (ECF subfamily)
VELERSEARFETTSWSLIEGLKKNDRAAEDLLSRRYWPPVYAHLRARGKGKEEAAELTQAFWLDCVIARGLFERAAPSRGRLRTLLLTSLRNFLIDRGRRERKEGEGRPIPWAAMEREEARVESSLGGDPEAAFDRRWALAVLEEALERCRKHFRSKSKERHWELFEARTLRPSVAALKRPSLAELAERFGFRSANDVSAALQVVDERLAAIIQEVVAETVGPRGDIAAEVAEVRQLIAGRPV